MTNELKPCPVSDEMLVELIRAHSDPPLCRVCGEPLSFGAADHTGTKWAHYVRAPIDERTGERPLWHQPTQDHIDASYRYNPQPNPIVVRVAQELLERRQSRPSPAPTVSVEECVEAAFRAIEGNHPHAAPLACSLSKDEETIVHAVHALCVSRLTGAATRSETIENAARRVLSVFEVARSPSGMPTCRGPIPEGALKELDALLVAVESPAPPPPQMETAAVEEMVRAGNALRGRLSPPWTATRDPRAPHDDGRFTSEIIEAWDAALTRLRATTTGTKEDDNGIEENARRVFAPTPPPMETAAVEEHCSNCGRPWTSGESADNKCCWEERKCALTRLRSTTTGTKEDDNGNV